MISAPSTKEAMPPTIPPAIIPIFLADMPDDPLDEPDAVPPCCDDALPPEDEDELLE
jgi:hypothetical protein